MVKIIIADDSMVSRNFMKDILIRAGHDVVGEAGNGETAVEKYLELKPDLITMDITMPRKDGIEALKNIVEADPNAKVVVVTALGQNSKMLEALKGGAKSYVLKPFDAVSIISVIDEVLSRR